MIVISTTSEVLRVSPDSLVYIAADGNYSVITTVIGASHVVTMQLGQMEHHLAEMLDTDDTRFVRIGKSLIVNQDYITYIHPQKQKLRLSDSRTFAFDLTASKDALKSLKQLIDEQRNV